MNKSRPTPPTSERSVRLANDIVGVPFEPGEIVAGKYRVERVIGTGGMGVVLSAIHIELEERVALKLLKVEFHGDKDVVGRFAREAKAAVRIKSDYSAAVFDVGVDPVRGPFMVMEYLDGHDLAEVVTRDGPLPIRRAVEYIIQACEALSVAHATGITHRDVKPENLFLTKRADGREVVKVLDFGTSKFALTGSAFGGKVSPVTTQGLMGSPVYMSPEQIRSTADVDHRADIWSLGAVLYEILTGRCAFDGESITEVCAKVLESLPDPITVHRPEVPPALAAVIERCLQKKVGDRFQNTAELAIALLPFAPSRSRASAQRCMSILTAAGVSVSGLDLSPPSSMPPSSSQLAPLLIPSADSFPRDLALASGLDVSARAETLSKPAPEPFAPPGGAREAEPPAPRKLGILTGAVVVLLLLLGLLAAFLFTRSPASPSVRSRVAVLESEPPGATVFSDGRAIGTTPLQISLDVGPRALKFSKPGFESGEVKLIVSPNDMEPIHQRIELLAATSMASASPPQAPQAAPAPRAPLGKLRAPAVVPPPPVLGKKTAPPPASVAAPPQSTPAQPSASSPPPPPRAKLVDDKPRVPIVN